MRLIQYADLAGHRQVGVAESSSIVRPVRGVESLYELARQAISNQRSLAQEIEARGVGEQDDYESICKRGALLSPVDHPDPAHLFITGTGLTHLGSADARDKMHKATQGHEEHLTDTLRMFKWGVEGGRPIAGKAGVQPEWFYKGDGSIVVPPYAPIPSPQFAEDAGEEPEIVGIYLIGDDRLPYRLGFALANEFSDHVMERRNYLYLSHSKLRFCSFGPEILLGQLPRSLQGVSRIQRNGEIVWQRPFVSGEDNMTHTLENLEHHHFKYQQFLRPGDVHVHFFGTATVSFADGFTTQVGDVMEVELPEFGRALSNPIAVGKDHLPPGKVQML